ncbi:MAG TPA: enoyl-CoA hydratase-related protein [Marmoricola sp.]|nr:enoyl-CoA hydratase-related protein [Marmoricola sp.]
MSTPVSCRRYLGFDRLELDSSENRNALSIDLLTRLLAAVRSSAAGPARGLLLTHTGPAFCAGVDLKERSTLDRDDDTHSRLLAALLRRLWAHPRPVVAMVDGAVRGGGLGLLACADVVIATERSTFAYSEARVGVAPALVMAVTLPVSSSRRLLPHLLDARTFGTETARELGLVTSVVPTGDKSSLDDTLHALRSGAPDAQATIKRLVRDWVGTDVDALVQEMTSLSAELFAGEEAAEGMAAFAQRRAPSWLTDPEGDMPS